MKIIFIIISIFITSNVYSTEQKPDLLIIDKDTIYLKSFPLEKLDFKNSPFNYGEHSFRSTDCWRGYQAIWTIENDSLYLIDIIRDDSTKVRLDIQKYFQENGYEYKIKDGKILADWYTARFEDFFMTFKPMYHSYNDKTSIFESYRPRKKKILVIIQDGIIIENRIKNDISQK